MSRPPANRTPLLLSRRSWPEVRRIGDILRTETVGGVLLLIAAVLALAWANSPWSAAYRSLADVTVGPAALHLDLSLAQWAADGLLAIVIIAVFYTSTLHFGLLLLALAPMALFGLLVQRRVRSWWLLLPLAATAWALVHASGVHATVAGVALAFTVPVLRRKPGPGPGLAEHFEHRIRPLSAGVAVPVFAFFAAGVSVAGAGGLGATLTDSVALGVIMGLVVGKAAGVLGATWLVQRFTRARLAEGLAWWDMVGLALLAGVGFTVSLLIGELAFGAGSERDDHSKIGVLLGSLLSAVLATVVLRARNRHYQGVCALEERDSDADGVPDVYEEQPTRTTPS
ncbi:Na+/H+ antiporter NhaA [Micromonospora sp. NPDC053740]|uniref:Na+/H+ antiporter NhaA n=1 Tax=Micromonospora sp. NPDC053740 TaxID=3155173 RepID=UPI00344451E1